MKTIGPWMEVVIENFFNCILRKREGFVTSTANHTTEEMGNECFHNLMSVGLIEPVYERGCKAAKWCRMHPWIQHMVISVIKELRFFNINLNSNPISPAKFSRSENGVDEFSHRACLYLDFKNDGKSDELSMMRKLVVLQLGKWQRWLKHHIEVEDEVFLKDFGSMKHLSYLSLQGVYGITKLPASIGKLPISKFWIFEHVKIWRNCRPG
uniref:Disease resistance protein winged helix domain-containing protein n=1 Tax=Nelumbo nucifera TaxID=4432 RepID=A0A822XHX8_NELNU|nr:TPA_asm: hypothetical protein HUJ06_021300 [Nelumbo nucifera]